MKVHAIGVMRMSGIGKDSGKPYDFAQLVVLNPIEPAAKDNFNLVGYGFETSKLDMKVDAVRSFAGVSFPCVIEVQTEEELGRNGIRTVVAGFTAVPVKAAA